MPCVGFNKDVGAVKDTGCPDLHLKLSTLHDVHCVRRTVMATCGGYKYRQSTMEFMGLLQKSRRNQPQRPRVNAPQVQALKGGGGSELEKMGKIEGRFVGSLAFLFLVILLEGLFLAGSVRPACSQPFQCSLRLISWRLSIS